MKGSLAQQAERGLLGFFVAALWWAPLPLASNRPWAVAWLAAALWGLLAAAVWLRAWPGAGAGARPLLSRAVRRAWAPLLLLALFAAWVAAQWLGGLGGSAASHDTRLYLQRALAYSAGFALVLLLVDSDRRRLALFYGLLGAGVLQALLAIWLLSIGSKYDFAGTPVHHAGRALGTFHNADHLAHYMALTLSVGVGLMLAGMGKPAANQHGTAWRNGLIKALQFMMSVKMLVRVMLVVMVITLVLTRSRMGNASFFLSLLLLGVWTMAASTKLRKPAAILVVSLLIVDLVVIGQWVGLEKVVQRLEATDVAREASEAASAASAAGAGGGATATAAAVAAPKVHREETLEERLRPAVDTLAAIAARPLAGWGGGTYYTVFPQFKRASLESRFDHAHNDYTEIASDTGLVGLALLGGVFGLSFVRIARLVRDDQPAQHRGLGVGIAMAMLCALLHALVDFNLQIPANALTLTVLLATVWTMPLATAGTASNQG